MQILILLLMGIVGFVGGWSAQEIITISILLVIYHQGYLMSQYLEDISKYLNQIVTKTFKIEKL